MVVGCLRTKVRDKYHIEGSALSDCCCACCCTACVGCQVANEIESRNKVLAAGGGLGIQAPAPGQIAVSVVQEAPRPQSPVAISPANDPAYHQVPSYPHSPVYTQQPPYPQQGGPPAYQQGTNNFQGTGYPQQQQQQYPIYSQGSRQPQPTAPVVPDYYKGSAQVAIQDYDYYQGPSSKQGSYPPITSQPKRY